MSAGRFHLGWFLEGSNAQAWGQPWTGSSGANWARQDLFVDMARALERACFDYILLEDSSYVADSYGGSMEIYLKNAIATPRQDPVVVASLLVQATSRIGIVPTLGTFQYHPYQLARLIGTLDQVSDGRIGWNMVTGSSDRAAQNFGMPGMPEHDLRYDMADEFMEVVFGLWDSWEPDAILADRGSGVFADPAKVRPIDFRGEHYSSRGPLNSGPLPQGRAVIAQAGGSPRGRRFASRYAETIIASVPGVAAMKAYRDDVRSLMEEHGRKPDDCKVLFLVSPVIGQTREEAAELKRQRDLAALERAEISLAHLSKVTNIDFSVFDIDQPLGDVELSTNGHQSTLADFLKAGRDRTLREAIATRSGNESVPLVGTPDDVAAQMGEVMEEVGGDGFLFVSPNLNWRTVTEVADGLVPALQRRGLTRSAYSHAHLRDNLLEF